MRKFWATVLEKFGRDKIKLFPLVGTLNYYTVNFRFKEVFGNSKNLPLIKHPLSSLFLHLGKVQFLLKSKNFIKLNFLKSKIYVPKYRMITIITYRLDKYC